MKGNHVEHQNTITQYYLCCNLNFTHRYSHNLPLNDTFIAIYRFQCYLLVIHNIKLYYIGCAAGIRSFAFLSNHKYHDGYPKENLECNQSLLSFANCACLRQLLLCTKKKIFYFLAQSKSSNASSSYGKYMLTDFVTYYKLEQDDQL